MTTRIRHFLWAFLLITFVSYTAFFAGTTYAANNISIHKSEIQSVDSPTFQHVIKSLQIPFVPNIGQIKDKRVVYYADTFGARIIITHEGELVYAFPTHQNDNTVQGYAVREILNGAYSYPVIGEEKSITALNSYIGNHYCPK